MAYNIGPKIVTDGLVLALDAGSERSYPGSGTIWYDLSGNGNHGTLSDSAIGTTTGIMTFNGSNCVVITGFQPDFIHTNATHEYWINYTSFGGANGNHSSHRWYLGLQSATSFGWGVANNNNWGSGYNHGVSLGEWCKLTVVAEDGTARGYLNGEYTGLSFGYTQDIVNNPIGYYTIGDWDQGGQLVNGKISHVIMYDRALTQAEITQNYNAQKRRFSL